MWQKLISTQNDKVTAFIRLILAFVMFPHGAQKAFAWFGGFGFNATVTHFHEQMGISVPLAILAILAESVGVVLLLTGFLTRLAALGVAVNMLVAVAMVHYSHGFFMNWSGQQVGEGYEYHILAVCLSVVLMIRGGGAASLDLSLLKSQWLARSKT